MAFWFVASFYTFLGLRTLTLLVNIVTLKPVTSGVIVSIDYSTAAAAGFDPFWYQKGFAGHTRRLIQAKKLLDDQVAVDRYNDQCSFLVVPSLAICSSAK